MLDEGLKNSVNSAVISGLDRAEFSWGKIGKKFIEKSVAISNDSIFESVQPSIIPGHPWVDGGIPKVTEFIALVIDMRDSTGHLKTVTNNQHIKNGFQRIFYETSALFPAISEVVDFGGGVVTEYLGDGALALFKVDEGSKVDRLKDVHRLAKLCVGDIRAIINGHLRNRYDLPAINLGVGISIGNAMVTLVGSEKNMQPRAIGQCVWEATKLSGGTNSVLISDMAKGIWPTVKSSSMQFMRAKMRDVVGYELKNKII